MSFFDDKKHVTEELLVDHVMTEFSDAFYKLYGFQYQLAANGGPVYLTRDLNDTDAYLPVDENLKQHIMVHTADGQRIARISIPPQTISIFFLVNEKLLVLKRDGIYHIYNPYDFNTDKTVDIREIPLRNYFIDTQQGNGIKLCISDSTSMVLLAGNNTLHFVYQLDNPKRVQLLEASRDYRFESFTESSVAYYMRPNGREYQFFIACLGNGILKVDFDGKVNGITKILGHINSKINKVYLSPSKKLLAVLTETWNIFLFKVADLSIQFRIELTMTEKDIQRFKGINWIKDHAICLCFNRYVRFITRIQPIFEKRFGSGVNSGEYNLLYCSESDGLRILAVNSKGVTKNVLIRKLSKAHENVKGMLSFSPGAMLYLGFKAFLKKTPPDEEDIVDDKVKLRKGIEEVIKAAGFELDQKKQMKLLKAASYGKVFLEDDTFDHNTLHNTCREVKLWSNMLKSTGRALSLEEFKKMIKSSFNTLVDILIGSKQFQLACHLCNFVPRKKKLINDIFKQWVTTLLNKNENDESCASTIIDTFNKVVEANETLQSTILLEIASDALKLNRKRLAEILLKKENPPLLKITVYINMGQYESALDEALKENDSNCLYLIIGKILEIADAKSRNDIFSKMILKGNPVLTEHFFKFLRLQRSWGHYSKAAQLIKDSKQFYLKNEAEYLRHSSSGAADIIGTQLSLMKDALSRNEKNKKTSTIIFENLSAYYKLADKTQKSSVGTIISSGFVQTMSADSFLTPIFTEEKEGYLYNPAYPFDKRTNQIATDLKISVKQLIIKRLSFMLANSNDSNAENIVKFIELHIKKGISLLQLRLLFYMKGLRNLYLRVLDKQPLNPAFTLFEDHHLYFEAAYVAMVNNKRDMFQDALNKVSVPADRKELVTKAEKAFK